MERYEDPADLAEIATGRRGSLFESDLGRFRNELGERVGGRRILVIGGAGSIGSATIKAVLPYTPAALHIVDQSENNLAELVRDIRGSNLLREGCEMRALPLDYGAGVTRRLLHDEEPYNLIWNFAAIKHVRSEKDVCSVLQMFDTNLVKQRRLIRWLGELGWRGRYFGVSTDKAANPINLMGASKRMMELLIFGVNESWNAGVTSARFANVAFSDGSLLHGFFQRVRKKQAIAAPKDVRRYFVSLEESGHICLLAAVLAPDGCIAIPKLDPQLDAVEVVKVAKRFLERNGFRPEIHGEESAAVEAALEVSETGSYPLLVTNADTTGEKEVEEFYSQSEHPADCGFENLLGIVQERGEEAKLNQFLDWLETVLDAPAMALSKDDIVSRVGEVLEEFKHQEFGANLDGRM